MTACAIAGTVEAQIVRFESRASGPECRVEAPVPTLVAIEADASGESRQLGAPRIEMHVSGVRSLEIALRCQLQARDHVRCAKDTARRGIGGNRPHFLAIDEPVAVSAIDVRAIGKAVTRALVRQPAMHR